jgi:RNA-binding protein 7
MLKEDTNGNTGSEQKKEHIKKDHPDNKDRTLFCINIDTKCTEDILYELFLQAGPLENIIRKEDRNGNLICLIIYKHAQSCEYALNLFNGIQLFNMSLKVQLSQQPGQQGALNKRPPQAKNNYANLRHNRQSSSEQNTPSSSPINNKNMLPPHHNSQNQLAQQFNEFGTGAQFQNPYANDINRMVSNSNMGTWENQNNDNNHHQSRRNNNDNNNFNRNNDRGFSNDYNNRNNHNNQRNGSYDNRNQSRDHNNRNNDRQDDRSRSPLRKRNRF